MNVILNKIYFPDNSRSKKAIQFVLGTKELPPIFNHLCFIDFSEGYAQTLCQTTLTIFLLLISPAHMKFLIHLLMIMRRMIAHE